MSTTLSDRVCDLVVSQLIAAAAECVTHTRLYMGPYLGIDPADVFDGLMSRADRTVVLPDVSGHAELRAVGAGSSLLIPYLIRNDPGSRMNCGTEGFASLVRGRFTASTSPIPVRVLLILAVDPIETIRTAGDDATRLPALSWSVLCERAAASAQGGPAGPLVSAVASDIAKADRPTESVLRELVAIASNPWVSAEAAGRALPRIGVYVAAPEAAQDPGRLPAARSWRLKLERWTEPGADLEGSLRKELGDALVVDRILNGIRPQGLDYSTFILGDLEAAMPTHPPKLRRPIRGYLATLTCTNGFALWLAPAGSAITLKAVGNLTHATADLVWADGERVQATVDGQAQEVSVQAEGAGWRFGNLTVRRGRTSDSALLAIYFAEGSWFPVEAGTVIDIDNQAFLVEADAEAYLVSPARNLGRVEIDTSGDPTDERIFKTIERNQEQHDLPIYLQGQGDQIPGPEGPDEPPDEKPDEPIDEISPVHAMVLGESADIRLSERGDVDELEMTVGGRPYRLAPQQVGSLNGLSLEREILASPAAWAFTAVSGDSGGIRPDASLERVSMVGVPQRELNDFQRSRSELFAALAPFGSAYAVIDEAVRPKAFAYVRAYKKLVEALPKAGRYQPEYDRILLIDTVFLTGAGDRYIAPTNPLTIAFYLSFWGAAADWCVAGSRPSDADLRTISPRHLLPLLNAGAIWHEAVNCDAFLWRRYQPLVTSIPAMDYDDRFIARKLDFFLDVHPAYSDPDQSLSISLYEPGDGVAVVRALERFYWPDLTAEQYARPRLQLNLLSRGAALPEAIARLLGGSGTRPIDHLVRSRVTVSSHDALPEQGFANLPFSHITFVHRTATERRPGPVSLDERASTLFVAGLCPASRRASTRTPNGWEFYWGTFGGALVGSLNGADAASDLQAIERRCLELVGGQNQEMLHQGETRMLATRVSSNFMRDVYARSIWVVHMERLIGLELFEPQPGSHQRYLIQYEESFAGLPGLDGITATEHVDPYHKALKEALRSIEISRQGLDRLLNLLNAVAGGWALELLHSGTEDVLAMVGVVAAIAALQDLDNSFDRKEGLGVLLSVREMLEVLPATVRPPDRSASDDLVFVWIPFNQREAVSLTARLVEVKFSTLGRPEFALARQQLENTKHWLEATFNSPGPEHLFRARDMSEFIRAAAARNRTFGLGPAPDRAPFEAALALIAAGSFRVDARFWVEGRELASDVVSIELESDSDAVRTDLPGAGEACGLIRLGRQCIEDLADGRRLSSSQPWSAPAFAQPGKPQTSNEASPAASTSAGAGQPGRTATPSVQPEVEAEVRRLARELDAAVIKYDLELEPFRPQLAQVGPSVIRFRSKPLGKQALEGIARRAADLGREVGVPEGVLIGQEPYYVTVDVPRRERQVVYFSDHVEKLSVARLPGALSFLLGIAPSGDVAVEDIARLPHLLIAGATGSGKSILLRSILCSLLLVHPPDELRIFLVDPKQIDFMPFEDVPHLVNGRIITDPVQAVADLQENIEVELSRRRPILKRAGVTNALDFYEAGGTRKQMPQMVIMVDEFADLASTLDRTGRAAFMSIIQRYGQLTRAFGIYLVLATQRPSVQVITGDIKANLTARVALKLLAPQDSVTILGHGGAESLRDKGDLIFEHAGRRDRLQGFLVRPQDVASAVNRWRRDGGSAL